MARKPCENRPGGTFGPDWEGTLQSDGYSVYGIYCKDSSSVTGASCMAHIRRKFIEALEAGEMRGAPAIESIARLYQPEEQLRTNHLSTTRDTQW